MSATKPTAVSAGLGIALDQTSLLFKGDDYHFDSEIINLSLAPEIAWHRSYYSPYESISPALTLGVKGHLTFFSSGHTDLSYTSHGVSGTVDGLAMGRLSVLGGGPFVEWGVDYHLPKSSGTALGAFFYGALLAGSVRVAAGPEDSEALSDSLIAATDSEAWDELSAQDQEKVQADLSDISAGMADERGYPFFAPEVGLGILLRKNRTEFQLIGFFRLYPDAVVDGLDLDGAGLHASMGRHF